MKKILALLLALSLIFAFAACSNNAEDETTTTTTEAITDEIIEDNTDEFVEEPSDEAPAGFTLPEGKTFAQYLLDDFNTIVAENPDFTTEEIATELAANEAILFMSGAMPVEAGFLSGFSDEITGFESATMFGPMMGSIAFVGYVFELADGEDVEAFKTKLNDLADPRWQICVAAEETVCESVGNLVFFVMAPLANQ